MHMKKELKSQDDRRESGFERWGEENVSGEVECKMLVHFRCKCEARTEHGLWGSLQVSQLKMHIFP